MADFKLLGSEDPVITSIGQITQGLGFPLREVEPAVSGGPVDIVIEDVFDSSSFLDQEPSGLGVDLQLLFGAPAATAFFSIDALGAITCLQTGIYSFRMKLVVGRRGGAAGVAQLYIRVKVNGVAAGLTAHAIIDNPDIEIPIDFFSNGPVTAGDIITFEIVRDTDGNNSGGLYAGIPTVVGWASSPSSRILISRFLAVTP